MFRRLYAGGIEWGFAGINDSIAMEVLAGDEGDRLGSLQASPHGRGPW